jgi:predicted metal-binding membrane protein
MTGAPLETLLKRDRLIVGFALLVVTALAWAYLLWLAAAMNAPGGMPGMPDMPDMQGMSMAAPSLRPWTLADFAFTFVMWAVMMVGMMLPSASPMILIYARVARQPVLQGRPLAATGWFAGGYLLSWTAFSLLAAIVQGLLERAALLTPMMTAATNRVGAAVLILAGLYQWLPLKNACLRQCRTPFQFIQSHGGFKPGVLNSVRLGFQHGMYCVGCCWALMALLFVLGVMNVLWVAAIAILVLIEKVTPAGRFVARVAGAAFLAAGLWLLLRG